MSETLLSFCGHLALLSLISIGGAHAVLPDVHRYLVNQHSLMDEADFGALVALSQAAPGPNVLVMALLGFQVGGVMGAVLALLAFCLPSSILVLAFSQAIARAGDAHWVDVLKRGLAPLTSGLVLGSAGVLAQSAVLHDGQVDMAAAVIAVVVAALAVLTRWNPFWLIVGAGAAGVVLA